MQYDAAYVVSSGTSEGLVSSYCSACLVRPRGRIACIAFANHYRAQLAPERKEVVAQVTRGGYTVLVTMGSLARHARPTGAGLDVMRGLACAPIWSPGEPPPRDHRTLRRQLAPGAQPAETPLQPISPSPDAPAGDSAGREAHRGSGGSSRVILPQDWG